MSGWASPAGALLGLMGGIGLLLIVAGVRGRRVTLAERLAPALRPRDATSGLLREQPVRSPFPVVERLLAPWLADVARWAERLGSPRAEVRRRLDRAGSAENVDQFRARQVVWTVGGLAAGLALALLIGIARGFAPVPLALLVAICGACGFAACDQLLSRQIAQREERMVAEFPTVAELLALAVTAGESPVSALERVAGAARGELSAEIRRMLADVRAGAPIGLALTDLADRTGLPSLMRFAEGVAVALERGTPLAEVLRLQAQDVREAGRRALMEAGGRKEVAMLVPVVFLILPVTVVYAVFPSLATLRVGL
ncbi:type II secretion system F family protein [Xylanimonas allomyrinae]|uniref:Type II secretion system F family protein n=1 Tax=Xylanimonas allomyrinae TaxID=2509459 RepID=A0A4P6EJ65_9MICO|nr:type II secretion system F family protein [Xylanimonas allomyrinae]QAY62066.1 type II secretion system F family protein [Xylanimonas allomyrinae]